MTLSIEFSRHGNRRALAAASKRFGRFKDENPEPVRKARFSPDKKMGRLEKAWMDSGNANDTRELLFNCGMEIFGIELSAKDIENFCVHMAKFQGQRNFSWKSGLFLSALVAMSPENRFIFDISHLASEVQNLGCMNRKNIVVKGNAGAYCGNKMNGGTITIEGDAKRHLGIGMGGGSILVKGNAHYGAAEGMRNGIITVMNDCGFDTGANMEGGSLIIHGNATHDVGRDMKGGEIIVKGNVAGICGGWMHAGSIHVDGDIGRIGEKLRNGKIFHRGVQIRPEGGHRE